MSEKITTLSPKQFRAMNIVTDPKRRQVSNPPLDELVSELGLANKQSAHNLIRRLLDKGVIYRGDDGLYHKKDEPPE